MTQSKLPHTLDFSLSTDKILHFIKKPEEKALAGVSEKAIYYEKQSRDQVPYFIKLPKDRHQNAILPREVAPALYQTQERLDTLRTEYQRLVANEDSPQNVLNQAENTLKTTEEEVLKLQRQYDAHRATLIESQSFLEVLGPCVAEKIFGNFIAVPQNYFCRRMLEGGHHRIPFVLSKGIANFNEFLSFAPIVKDKKAVKDWDGQALPSRSDLASILTPEHAKALGKLHFVALLMGHLDVLNNINLSNSGVVPADDGGLIPAIVDWGNTMGAGFGGLSPAENAFRNPDINPQIDNANNRGLSGFKHCVPFDTMVYPLLPRQLVSDLFDMSSSSALSQAMLQGFEEAYELASKQQNQLDELIPSAIEETLKEHTAEEDRIYMGELLKENKRFYFPQDHSENSYTLVNVIKGRIQSLSSVLKELHEGKSLNEIASERLKQIVAIHTSPPTPRRNPRSQNSRSPRAKLSLFAELHSEAPNPMLRQEGDKTPSTKARKVEPSVASIQ